MTHTIKSQLNARIVKDRVYKRDNSRGSIHPLQLRGAFCPQFRNFDFPLFVTFCTINDQEMTR